MNTVSGLDFPTLRGMTRQAKRNALDANAGLAERQWEEMWKTDDYENEYYYVGQLFETNWQPRVMA